MPPAPSRRSAPSSPHGLPAGSRCLPRPAAAQRDLRESSWEGAGKGGGAFLARRRGVVVHDVLEGASSKMRCKAHFSPQTLLENVSAFMWEAGKLAKFMKRNPATTDI